MPADSRKIAINHGARPTSRPSTSSSSPPARQAHALGAAEGPASARRPAAARPRARRPRARSRRERSASSMAMAASGARSAFRDPTSRGRCRIRRRAPATRCAQALPQLARGRRDARAVRRRSAGARRDARSGRCDARGRARCRVLTAELDDPDRLRPHRPRRRRRACSAIVEHKDATPEQRAIREINTGVMAAPTACFAALARRRSTTDNAQRRVLPDRRGRARGAGRRAGRRRRAPRTHRDARASTRCASSRSSSASTSARRPTRCSTPACTLADPARIDVRGKLDCGARRAHRRRLRVRGRGRRSATASSIGPYCVLRNVTVGAGTRSSRSRTSRTPTIGAQLPHRAVRAAAARARCSPTTCTSATSSR